jgi:NOL1/NOP2/fmu family ribosome biogenesis protein
LKKETFEHSMIAKGWYLVTFEGFALGWLKNIGNRINNYYPSNDRILSKNPLPS